jgi:hypothetical protein
MALDHRIGRKRRRHRDQPDAAGRRWFEPLERPPQRLVDPERQVAPGGQRLGGGRHPPAFAVDQHRIGVGAAGIDAGKKRRIGRGHEGKACLGVDCLLLDAYS